MGHCLFTIHNPGVASNNRGDGRNATALRIKNNIYSIYIVCVCVCVCVCTGFCGLRGQNLFNNMGMTEVLQFEGVL